MDTHLPKQVVQALVGAYKGLRLYPLEHPAIQRQMGSLVENIFAMLHQQDVIRIGVLEGTLFLGDHLFVETNPAAEELAELLDEVELNGIEFHHGVTAMELGGLLQVFKEHRAHGEDFADALRARGVRHIQAIQINRDDDEDNLTANGVYRRALEVVDRIFQDVRMGTIPASDAAIKTVKGMVHMTLTEPHALFAMSMLKDYDNYTFTHSVNVSVIALTVGRACGLDEQHLRILGLGALLHDIGKLEVDWGIINKPGQLTDEEFEAIKRHPQSGARIVEQMEGITPEVIDIVLGHHLHFNQDGYPAEARGEAASPMVEMAAIADTYDAMTTLRSYQRPMPPSKAIARLREIAGSVLHPDYVEQFIDFLGPWPVGTLVRLSSNEIGLVTWVGTEQEVELKLKVLFDAEGALLPQPQLVQLAGAELERIVDEIDPFLKGINVTDYLY